MKKLLIIGWVWPEPNSSAAGSRMMQLIDSFQQQAYQITFASPAQTTEHMVNLADHGIDTQAITLNCDSFDHFIKALSPDAVMFDRFMMEEQFGWRVATQCPNALRVLDTEDLQCLRNARHAALKQQRDFNDADLHSDMALREVAAIFRSDLTLMISPYEMTLLQERFSVPVHLLFYVPFLYSQEELNIATPSFTERQHFISIGNFRHAPNWDAVLWLKQQIWPIIRKELPDAQLNIYGAYPPKKATDLHDVKSGFLVKGWVDDAFIVMQQAKVCLAPLRFGAGIKGKLADAMLCGTPSVTTDIGAEGMATSEPWGGEIVNSAEEIAKQAITLYQQEALWQQASDLGKHNAQQLFNKNTYQPLLTAKIKEVSENLLTHRCSNFIGAMLNHHHHKSTQYMSQWIAAKNKILQE